MTMAAPNGGNKIPGQAPAVALKLPGISISFTGFLALIPLAILLALAGLFIFYLVRANPQSMLWVSGVLWILFIVYWSAAASNTAPIRSSESAASRQLHQYLMYGALAIAFWRVPGFGQRWLPVTLYIGLVGLAIQISAALLAVWARRHLGRNWSGEIAAKVDHQLIRTGPYRLVRHPIYSGMLGMFIGTAVVSGELHGLLAVVIIAGAYLRKVRLEERHLGEVFGAAYDDYRRHSSALIPWLL
jgi:protein-S-isoprenylcysteine O-methyltransferase Ste14